MRHRPIVAAVGSLVSSVLLAGCGDTADGGELHVERARAEHPSAGAAGNFVDCTAWGHGAHFGQRVYSEGATAKTPRGALKVARSEGGYDGVLDGWKEAKREQSRVLYVIEVEGVAKQAVIVHDGPATKGSGGDGWYVESFARCDDSELPASYARSIGLELWTGRDGKVAPTTRIRSYTGRYACETEHSTFLYLGETLYVGRPDPGFGRLLVGPYRPHGDLPADAVDTGFERDGRHLWLSADERHAFVGTRADVADWPTTKNRIGCG